MQTQEAPKKTTYFYKLVRVSRADGRATTVSMDPILVTKACQVLGSFKAVNRLIRDAAVAYDETLHKSRSGFVAEQLRHTIAQAVKQRKAEKELAESVSASASQT